jgi:hypothetical protein
MNVGAATLLTNAGAGNGADVIWPGGKTALVATATFGGGNIKLQVKIDIGQAAAVYADVASSTLSAAGMLNLDLPPGTYRAVVTTSTAAYAKLVSVPLT